MTNNQRVTAAAWRLPAEWEPQEGVQLTWPHAATDWAPILDEITATYEVMAREIAKRERLLIIAPKGEALSPLTFSPYPPTIRGHAIMDSSPLSMTRATAACSTSVSTAGARSSLPTSTTPSTDGSTTPRRSQATMSVVLTSYWRGAPSRATAKVRSSPLQDACWHLTVTNRSHRQKSRPV